MKGKTKEYYEREWLSYAEEWVKESAEAEERDEAFYAEKYEEERERFAEAERRSDKYRNPEEDARKIEEYVNEEGISTEERARRIAFREMHGKIAGKGKRLVFDEATSKQRFEQQQKKRTELFGKMPQEILEKVADLRVLALGYASAEVKDMLKGYCAALKRETEKIRRETERETEAAERGLTKKIVVNDLEGCVITGIEETEEGIYLKGERGGLFVKEGEIVEGKEKEIYEYDEDLDGAYSRIVSAELHRSGDRFELHLFVSNCDEYDREDLWYLTVSGSDILEFD